MKKILTTFLCIVCLSGCGKRGRPDFPPDSTYPRQYPARRDPKPAVKVVEPDRGGQPQSILELNQYLETGSEE